MTMGPMVTLSSSNLSAAGYDPAAQLLVVVFQGGSAYQYTGVPPAKWEALQAAPSPGHYLNAHIKPFHEGSRR